jgi:hypothetical protein
MHGSENAMSFLNEIIGAAFTAAPVQLKSIIRNMPKEISEESRLSGLSQSARIVMIPYIVE